MKTKQLTAYAVIKKKSGKIDPLDLYRSQDVADLVINKDEKIIKVKISEIK